MKYGFDTEKYIKIQSEHIRERIAKFGDKLYMEFGGKLFDDFHASRILPGFEPDVKLKMLEKLKDELEIIIVISAFLTFVYLFCRNRKPMQTAKLPVNMIASEMGHFPPLLKP